MGGGVYVCVIPFSDPIEVARRGGGGGGGGGSISCVSLVLHMCWVTNIRKVKINGKIHFH